MIKIENVETFGWEAALRGMRNPHNSWDKSDSFVRSLNYCTTKWNECFNCPHYKDCPNDGILMGPNDLDLAMKLCNAGTDHRKFMRMIAVYLDITAGHTFWAEFDTYKVGTVRDSCSKMHSIHVKEFTKDDFDHEGIDQIDSTKLLFDVIIEELETLRIRFNKTKEKKYWRAIIELLPMGYHLRATVELNYEVLSNIYSSRRGHKMDEWKEFCKWIETLPYANLITRRIEDEK